MKNKKGVNVIVTTMKKIEKDSKEYEEFIKILDENNKNDSNEANLGFGEEEKSTSVNEITDYEERAYQKFHSMLEAETTASVEKFERLATEMMDCISFLEENAKINNEIDKRMERIEKALAPVALEARYEEKKAEAEAIMDNIIKTATEEAFAKERAKLNKYFDMKNLEIDKKLEEINARALEVKNMENNIKHILELLQAEKGNK